MNNRLCGCFIVIMIMNVVMVILIFNRQTTVDPPTPRRMYLNNRIDLKRCNYTRLGRNGLGGPKIFCIILTTYDNYRTRGYAVQEIWGHKCEYSLFVTAKRQSKQEYINEFQNGVKLNLLHLDNIDAESYSNLTLKMVETFRVVYKKLLNTINEFDWILKADDDTLIIVENLKYFLVDKCKHLTKTFGYTRKGMEISGKIIARHGFNVGGAGYAISKQAFLKLGQKLTENNTFCPPVTGNEDLDIADCLDKLKITPGDSRDELGRERFHSEDYEGHWQIKFPQMVYESFYNDFRMGMDCCSNTSISFHHLDPVNMTKLYNLIYNVKPFSEN